ncbi:MAG TPA: hypothetical protein GX534_09070 [Thermoanaerobacterales bacterium]|nr:hypothetical protein [Thermoanaerobacterales bacterium]
MYKHLLKMTDSTGILQFSNKSEPLIESGYTVDDNARALIVAAGMEEIERERLLLTYTRFLKDAQSTDGIWHNWKIKEVYLPDINSEDSIGRGMLAASFAANCGVQKAEEMAKGVLKRALPEALKVHSPRATAYVLLGLIKLAISYKNKRIFSNAKQMAQRLINLYETNCCRDWHWFEDRLTYCNALLPHSLFGYYAITGDIKALRVATDTLNFLSESLFQKGYLNIVGNRGWWKKQSFIPPFDQQPVDAASIILACLQAFIATGDRQFISRAQLAYQWYWGNNINKTPLFNEQTQGCHDALVPDGVNLNQGAEAVVSFLMAHQVLNNVLKKHKHMLVPAV